MDLTKKLGLESIQREALKTLYSNLNTKIASLTATWATETTDFYSAIGRSDPGFTIENIEAENFVPGAVPSLIQAPIERYPNVACIAYQSTPKRTDDDTGENFTVILAVETMVKSDNFEADFSHLGEEQVNSRIQKTVEAIHQVFLENPTLGNTVLNLNEPNITIGDVFVRREEKSRGPRWFWQGGRLEYPVDKYVNLV